MFALGLLELIGQLPGCLTSLWLPFLYPHSSVFWHFDRNCSMVSFSRISSFVEHSASHLCAKSISPVANSLWDYLSPGSSIEIYGNAFLADVILPQDCLINSEVLSCFLAQHSHICLLCPPCQMRGQNISPS